MLSYEELRFVIGSLSLSNVTLRAILTESALLFWRRISTGASEMKNKNTENWYHAIVCDITQYGYIQVCGLMENY